MARKSSREKQFRIVKKNRTGLSLAMVAFLFGVITACILLTVLMFFIIVVDIKFRDESERVEFLAKVYEKGVAANEDPKKNVALNDQMFSVLDADGNMIIEHGVNLTSLTPKKLYTNSATVPYQVYVNDEFFFNLRDENDPSVITLGYGQIFKDIVKNYYSDTETEANALAEEWDLENMTDEEIQELGMREVWASYDYDMASYPIWFSVPVLDGKETFISLSRISLRMSDVIVMFITVFVVLGFLLLLVVILIIHLIRNGVRQKKVINTFLTDPVTKGHNWTWFLLRQEPILRRSGMADKKIAIIEVVFINYRNFCTCHSLSEGEQMLCKVNDAIKKKLAKGEVCAHVATSSFAVLLKYQNEIGLRERLRTMIEDLENIDRAHKFAFHFGVDLLPVQKNASGRIVRRKNLNLEEEYNNACTARATLSGSDDSRIAFFDQKLVQERMWVDQVHEHQEQAIKNEEFVVYYQPKYDPQTKTLRGAEALIRWNSPELGFISPGKFIPIFEKNGFITEIDHYMISHVARDQKAWLDQGLKCVPVSVNVSRAHFIESDLAEQIRRMVDEAGAPRNMIEIELTESAFFDDKNALINTIQKLKEYGFMVSMDDFGAGYSSLNSLKDMPLDVLKLDADFFRGETEGGRGEIVVSEAIKLAKKLNMHTVAEGVEEKDQVEFLAKQGCDMIQGYFFSEPLPKEKYVESMRSGISERAKEFEPAEAEGKPFEEKPFEEKPFEEKPFEEKPFEHKDVIAQTKAEEAQLNAAAAATAAADAVAVAAGATATAQGKQAEEPPAVTEEGALGKAAMEAQMKAVGQEEHGSEEQITTE
ncbi:MAG: GGDEF domain-containing protein [Lachnospiraceae bacterium]|nr:GGDEF domain-containing protein [Lachnospiraceae bacterium]